MININMTSSEGIILDTSRKYCAEDIKVIPAFGFAKDTRRWNVNVIESTVSQITMISNDDFIKEYYNDERLHVNIEYKGSIICARQFLAGTHGNKHIFNNRYGYFAQVNSDGTSTGNYMAFSPLYKSSSAIRFKTNANGDIIILNNEVYTVAEGEYTILAWLD